MKVFLCSLALTLCCLSSYSQTPLACDNWLYLPNQPSYVSLGEIDITGNQITVEAVINRTTPYAGGRLYAGDIVSKHDGPGDANYLLRPNSAEITTSGGYYITPEVCEIQLNKTYHVAMVYDGTTLKFYRNGFLMSQIAATGNLYQNSWQTIIGFYQNQAYNENFIGYINEVRIWNVARTQTEIRANMDKTLASPSTQVGLKAYYSFSSLNNLQGAGLYNGQLNGNASIGKSNPACNFAADSCCIAPNGNISGSTICSGETGTLTFSATSGTGPFTIGYSDGVNNYSASNIVSNVPFTVPANIINSTNYKLVSVNDGGACPALNQSGPNATITVIPLPQGGIEGLEGCEGTVTQLTYRASTGTSPFAIKITDGSNTYDISGLSTTQKFAIPGGINTTTKNFELLEIKDANAKGCKRNGNFNSAIATSTVNRNPVLQFNQPAALCSNSPVQKLVTPDELSGSRGNGVFSGPSISSDGYFNATAAGPGSHLVRYLYTTDKGCSAFKEQTIVVNASPNANAGFDQLICANFPVTLSATGGNSYSWSPGPVLDDSTVQNPVAKLSSSTVFRLLAKNNFGCVDSAFVTIKVKQPPVFVSPADTSICAGTRLRIDGKNDMSAVYSWAPAQIFDDPSSPSPVATFQTSTSLQLRITDTVCKNDSLFNVTVHVNPLPSVTASHSNDIDCTKPTTHLLVTGAEKYAWLPAENLDNSFISNPIATAERSTVFVVKGTNEFGCSSSDSVAVTVVKSGEASIYIPNAFTPNGDGKNDCFGIMNVGNVQVAEFSIFNRWGQLVFSTKKTGECWNGNVNGRPQEAGAYMYVLKGSSFCGPVKKTGTLILVR